MEEVGLASEAYLLEADSDPGKIDNEVPAAVGQMFAGHFNRSSVAVLITISISVLFCGAGFLRHSCPAEFLRHFCHLHAGVFVHGLALPRSL